MRLLEDICPHGEWRTLRLWQEPRDCNYHMGTTMILYYSFLIFVLLGHHCCSSPRILSCPSYPVMDVNLHGLSLVGRLQMHSLKWVLIRLCQSSSILLATHKGSLSLSPSFLAVMYFLKQLSRSRGAGRRDRRWGWGQGWNDPTDYLAYTMWQTRPEKQPCLKIHG